MVPSNSSPMGSCDGTGEDLAEFAAIVEAEDAGSRTRCTGVD